MCTDSVHRYEVDLGLPRIFFASQNAWRDRIATPWASASAIAPPEASNPLGVSSSKFLKYLCYQMPSFPGGPISLFPFFLPIPIPASIWLPHQAQASSRDLQNTNWRALCGKNQPHLDTFGTFGVHSVHPKMKRISLGPIRPCGRETLSSSE